VRLHAHRKTLLAAPAEHPAAAVVLMEPPLWSRIEPQNGGTQLRTHVSGPVTGDVVLVTDTPALEALVGGRNTYNTRRPHSSLGWKTPAAYAAGWRT
jgi:hypothetical protein